MDLPPGAELDFSTLNLPPEAELDLPPGAELDLSALAGQKESILHKAGRLALKAITPFPGFPEAKAKLEQDVSGILGAARPAILNAPESTSPVDQAVAAARSSIIPLPSPELASGLIEATAPIAPLDTTATAASLVLPAVARLIGRGVMAKPVIAAAESAKPAAEAAPGIVEATLAAERPSLAFLNEARTETLNQLNRQKQLFQNFQTEKAGLKLTRGETAELSAKQSGIAGLEAKAQNLTRQIAGYGKVPQQTSETGEAYFQWNRFLKQASPEEAEKVVQNLSELDRASSGPNPLVKNIAGNTPMATAVNILERAARPRLDSEQALLGLKQTVASERALVASALEKAKAGEPVTIKEGQKAMEAMAEAIASGEVDASEGARLLGMEIKSPEDAVEMARNSLQMGSSFGRGLAQLSVFQRSMLSELSRFPEAADILDKAKVPETTWQRAAQIIRSIEGVRMAALISQPVTAMRNVMSQGVRYSLQIADDAMSGLGGAVFKGIPARDSFDLAAADVVSAFRSLSQGGKMETLRLLDKFPDQSARLVGSVMGDIMTGRKITNALTFFTRLQEGFFRRAAFDAYVRQTASLTGRAVEQLTEAELSSAVNHALNLTWANKPQKNSLGGAILNAYSQLPFLTALGPTFPRFWLNGMRFIYDFSPIPLLRPQTYAAMTSLDSRVAFSALNKAAIGTAMLSSGFAADRAGYTGERWYEVNVPGTDKTTDIRPYFPLSPFFFLGRMLSRTLSEGKEAWLKLSGNDWIQAFISMRRTDLNGIPVSDWLNRVGTDGFKNSTLLFLGQYLSGFSTPGRAGMDFLGHFNQEERLPRFQKESPFLGPTMANIPFLERSLPVQPAPFRSAPEERLYTLARQLTGFNIRQKTPVEIESDRLGIRAKDIYPKTGAPEFDRLITEKMGPLLEEGIGRLITSPAYLTADNKEKKFLFLGILSQFRRGAKDIVRGERPDLAIREMVKNSKEFMREKLEDRLQQNENRSP